MKTRTWGPGWGVVTFWLVAASAVMLLQPWLVEASFEIAGFVLVFLLMLGLGLLIVLLAIRTWDAALVFVAATVVLPFLPFNYLGHQAWTRISFMQHHAAYEKIVVRAPDLPDHGKVEGETYRKDGRRIAFQRSEAFLDGWGAVVYDPTTAMDQADDTNIVAFGSTVESCIRIERDWYRCWFD